MSLDAAGHRALADRILEAMRTGVGIEPPRLSLPLELEDSYAVQRVVIDELLAAGDRVSGFKIGFTSRAMQEMYGVDEPDFGRLLASMDVPPGGTIVTDGLVDPRIEPEVAFVLSHDLRGPGVDVEAVLAATATVHASFEVIDSRVGSERAKGVDSIADNAGAGRVVLAAEGFDPRGVDLAALAITMDAAGEHHEGLGEAAFGHPAASVAWLANKLAEVGEVGGTLDAGHVVLSGSVTRSVAMAAGQTARGSFGALGELEVHFA